MHELASSGDIPERVDRRTARTVTGAARRGVCFFRGAPAAFALLPSSAALPWPDSSVHVGRNTHHQEGADVPAAARSVTSARSCVPQRFGRATPSCGDWVEPRVHTPRSQEPGTGPSRCTNHAPGGRVPSRQIDEGQPKITKRATEVTRAFFWSINFCGCWPHAVLVTLLGSDFVHNVPFG
jgi:hypothetical protein